MSSLQTKSNGPGRRDRDEAGTPNVIGALAMAVAAQVLMEVGMDQVAAHEQELVGYTLERLRAMKGITIYGETDPARANEKVSAIPFNLSGVSHFLLASILGYEAGVGVRSGCFCAHPYVVHLLKLTDDEAATWREQLLGGDKSSMPVYGPYEFRLLQQHRRYRSNDGNAGTDRSERLSGRIRAGDCQR